MASRQLFRAAIVRAPSASFAGAEVRTPSAAAVDVALAQSQHAEYVKTLRRFVPNVIELPTMEAHPDCCFVEDVALTNLFPGHALITNVGVESRRGEEGPVADALRVHFGLSIVDMRDADPNSDGDVPALDGGDVLFTGRDVFVGVSERTNPAGVAFLRDRGVAPALRADHVHASPVFGGLHLKSVVTHLDDETLVVADSEGGHEMFSIMNEAARGHYHAVFVEEGAANVMPANGAVFCAGQYPKSLVVLDAACSERGFELVALDNGEFEKMDGAHTCKSLLIPLAASVD